MLNVRDHTVLVTGGSRGIGRAIVEELAEAGARVAFTYHTGSTEAEELVKKLEAEGARLASFRCDVRSSAEVRRAVDGTIERFGPIDGLVNNAGITRDRLFVMMGSDDWGDVIDTDLTGAFHGCRAVAYAMTKRRQGRIVNIGSVSGTMGNPGQANYAAAKAGLVGLSKALARELARFGVTVNVVSPGYIDAGMVQALPQRNRRHLEKAVPLGRVGEAWEVARLVRFLLSDDAGYITGQVFHIDGGIAI